MVKKLFAIGLMASLAAAAVPVLTHAANVGTLTISPTSVKQGGTMTVSGDFGDQVVGNVSFTLATGTTTNRTINPATNVTLDANGAFSTTLTVPSDFPTGSSVLTAFSPNGTDTMTGNVTITSSTATTPTGGVAAGSGGISGLGLEIALMILALAAGAGGLAFARRKKLA